MAYFDDNQSTSVFWILNPTSGYAIKAISYEGNQIEIPTLPVFYNVINVNASVSILPRQNTIIIDSPTNGETFPLPLSSNPDVVPGLPYRFIMIDGAITSNTIAVESGDSINGVVDGTYSAVAQVSGILSFIAISTGTGWLIFT